MVSGTNARRARKRKPNAVRGANACPVGDSLFANIHPAARAVVRAAHRSADKTVFVHDVDHERLAAVAEDAGYLAPLGSVDGVFRITARGEAYLAALARAV